MKQFCLVLKDDHAWFWTATKSSTGAQALVAETAKFNWAEGDYGFALVTKHCDIYRCLAPSVHD